MGSYMARIPFSITIRDSQWWTEENLEAAGDVDLDDYAAHRLEEVMRAAGQAHVDANPDMYGTLV